MTDPAAGDDHPTDAPELVAPDDPIERVEGYRTDDGIVLYDARNPLAWVKSTVVTSVEGHR
ncbi:MAG: DUF7331 family protein [archaeon]